MILHATPFFRSLRPLLLVGALLPLAAQAQTGSVGIGTASPDSKAALDIRSTDKGLLIPRLDSTQRVAISTPPDGLMVFQTDGRKGFWYALGGSWLYLPNKTQSGDNLGNHTATEALNLNDNELRLRARTDTSHGLGWYGNSSSVKNWLGLNVDGPVLYGNGGGVLGTVTSGGRQLALAWTNAGRVSIGQAGPALPLDVRGQIGLRTNSAWDHLYFSHDGTSAFVNAGGAEGGLALRIGTGAVGSYGDQTYTEVVRVKSNGRVGINTNDPQQALDVSGTARATDFAYNATQTRYLSLGSGAFVSSAPQAYSANITIGSATGSPLMINILGGTSGQPAYLVAPVQLPQGAVITSISITAIDNDGVNIAPQALLTAIYPVDNSNSTIGVVYADQAVLTTEDPDWQTITKVTSHTVRNDLYLYNLRIRLNQNNAGTLFLGARIGYTVAQPD
ncbi:hypothetical protein [Hymenobacter negativus]|uniref:Uncharacterized protein n=1 Tax=Hymenobacter negativus TaxID=2795026 RepID=A0ABS3QC97_9BACT|nr:hypothetical protein [Hymenobacter negativus]MBO2008821.1 hypothetical protein [Hymenobacter negativus]